MGGNAVKLNNFNDITVIGTVGNIGAGIGAGMIVDAHINVVV